MSLVFTPEEIEAAGRPNVCRAVFVALDLTTGTLRLHNGVGRVQVGGQEWLGMTDPFGGRLVSIQGLEEPAFGQASAVTLTLSGADREFVRYIRSVASEIEGMSANIYWAMFDEETQAPLSALRGVFVRGKISAPSFEHEGIGKRRVSITIENIWDAMNFSAGRRWNDADQQRFYPGDKGMQFAGVKVLEVQR